MSYLPVSHLFACIKELLGIYKSQNLPAWRETGKILKLKKKSNNSEKKKKNLF